MGLRTAPSFTAVKCCPHVKKIGTTHVCDTPLEQKKKKGRNELRFYIMKKGFVEQVYNKILVN